MNDQSNEVRDEIKSKPKLGFFKLSIGLFGVFLSYWAAKNAFIHTIVFLKVTNENPDIPAEVLGRMSFPIVSYILVVIFGLFIIRKSFWKVGESKKCTQLKGSKPLSN